MQQAGDEEDTEQDTIEDPAEPPLGLPAELQQYWQVWRQHQDQAAAATQAGAAAATQAGAAAATQERGAAAATQEGGAAAVNAHEALSPVYEDDEGDYVSSGLEVRGQWVLGQAWISMMQEV